mmetsp:Transcript_99050/g.284750  ORF Transcript_99050/g.284750 Transcript_99050/m.284750 type:complete len:251 (-) Transcript_99050:1578-2330(-)
MEPATASASPMLVGPEDQATEASKVVNVDCTFCRSECISAFSLNFTIPILAMSTVVEREPSPKVVRSATDFANSLVASTPDWPMLPDMSRAITTSTAEAHFFAPSHASLLQAVVSCLSLLVSAKKSPLPIGARSTCRVRTRCPSEQALLQLLHGVHIESMQSWSQDCVLQTSSCIVSPSGKPPNCERLTMLRCRVRVPPPHACEHSPHSLQRLMSPSTGHGFSLHLWVPVRGGQSGSEAGAVTTRRVKFW